MKTIASRLTLIIGALTAIAASALWATFWWRWVEREYSVAPTGSNNLNHAILNEIGGTVLVGFSVFWLFRRFVCVLQRTQPPTVSPTDVIRYLAPTTPKLEPTSGPAIAYLMLKSAMTRSATNAAYRLCRLARNVWSR